MTQSPAEHRQPTTAYAALHAASDGRDAAAPRSAAPAQAAVSEPDYLAIEADKLESLKQALFAAFIAAPKTGIPTALVDLAATYTSALRLQLTLRGLGVAPKGSVKAQMFGAPRGK